MTRIKLDVLYHGEEPPQSINVDGGKGISFKKGETVLFSVGARPLVEAVLSAAKDGENWAARLLGSMARL